MIIPIYDMTILPCLSLPMKNTQKETKRYLGGIAMTQEVIAQANAVYNFWATDCNFGLEPFLAPIPIMGDTIVDPSHPEMLVQFYGDFDITKSSAVWECEFKLKIIGTVDYIVDDLGDFIVSDAGEYTVTDSGDYIPTGNPITSYRKVLYGN